MAHHRVEPAALVRISHRTVTYRRLLSRHAHRAGQGAHTQAAHAARAVMPIAPVMAAPEPPGRAVCEPVPIGAALPIAAPPIGAAPIAAPCIGAAPAVPIGANDDRNPSAKSRSLPR